MMKRISAILIVPALLTTFLLALCPSVSAQTQTEMNLTAAKEYATADAELNRVYKQLRSKLDKIGAEKLVKSQRAWLAFRNAEMRFSEDAARGGSMMPLLSYDAAKRLTLARIKDLKQHIEQYSSR